jgi:outer membrane protein TolC
MKKIILLVLCTFLYAENLKSLLDFADTNNNIIKSKVLIEKAKQKELESSQRAYYPTINVGAFYQSTNLRTYGEPGDVYSGYASVGVDLYDGGKKASTINQNRALLDSAKYSTFSYKKSLYLDIVNDFFDLQSSKESLKALLDKKVLLGEEVQRIKKFYEVGSATKDDVDRLEAAFSNNIYLIDSVKFKILSLKRLLSLKVGKNIISLDRASIKEPPVGVKKSLTDNIKELKQSVKFLEYSAKSINATYKPIIRVEDQFNLYSYGRVDAIHPSGNDYQNRLMLSFNIKLFDNGLASKKRESILLQKMSIDKQVTHLKEAQNINIELALSKIDTIKAQIVSAKSSLVSANSTYETIAQKFKAGIVDNVVYLDALSVKTNAKAVYEKSINELQKAYAAYYFYTNNNLKDYIIMIP